MRRGFGRALTGIGFALVTVLALLIAFRVVGTSDRLYFKLQMKADVLADAGISEAKLIEIDGALAAYLGGDPAALDAGYFNAREMRHMEDCFDLFALLRSAVWALDAAALAALVAGWMLLGDRRAFCRVGRIASLIPILAVAAVALWAAVDFHSAFTVFHKLLFTNDLWQLDPRTDLLIRICPASMFMAMGAIIAGLVAAAVAALEGVLFGLTRATKWNRRSES